MDKKESADKKCGECKCYRYPKQFLNDKGRELKTCSVCRLNAKKYRDKKKE